MRLIADKKENRGWFYCRRRQKMCSGAVEADVRLQNYLVILTDVV